MMSGLIVAYVYHHTALVVGIVAYVLCTITVPGPARWCIKVLEKCTKNFIGHSRLAFNNHESNIDC